jgi:cellulose biosynthesis protein BcsQ
MSVSIDEYYKNEFRIQKEEKSKIHRNPNIYNYDVKKCKIICFFVEKGGATNAVTLAYTFAENGYRVVMYDCDSQRSLSASMLGLEIMANQNLKGFDPLSQIINRQNINSNLYEKTLYDQVKSNNNNLKPAHAILIRKNLWLVPGNRNMSELDQVISNEELMSSPQFPFSTHINSKTGKPYQAILKTAEDCKADFVFLDLNPNKGPLNRCLVMSSNYVIIPAIADYHSAEMMNNMKENLISWCTVTNSIRKIFEMPDRKPFFELPAHNPKFLGFILNRIDSNSIGEIKDGIEINGYRRVERCWIDRVQECANNISKLDTFKDAVNYPDLPENSPLDRVNYAKRKHCSLAVSKRSYKKCKRTNKIGEVREFWGLKNISDIAHIPVPFLDDRHLIQYENDTSQVSPLKNDKRIKQLESIQRFKEVFSEIYSTIIKIINEDN